MRLNFDTIRFLGFILLLISVLGDSHAQTTSGAVQTARERLSLDRGWLFHEGDIPFPVIKGHQPSYDNAKAGRSSGAASPEFDDSSWKQVNLPHDWAVEQPFDATANIAQGYRQRGMGWYRKYFRLSASDRGKHLEIQLDGIATHSTVWVNGVLSARNWSGYNSIYIDITPFARYGQDLNVISVQVDANAMEGPESTAARSRRFTSPRRRAISRRVVWAHWTANAAWPTAYRRCHGRRIRVSVDGTTRREASTRRRRR